MIEFLKLFNLDVRRRMLSCLEIKQPTQRKHSGHEIEKEEESHVYALYTHSLAEE